MVARGDCTDMHVGADGGWPRDLLVMAGGGCSVKSKCFQSKELTHRLRLAATGYFRLCA